MSEDSAATLLQDRLDRLETALTDAGFCIERVEADSALETVEFAGGRRENVRRDSVFTVNLRLSDRGAEVADDE